jgi:RNA polymerase subunit RPABC4/transcription elongation factor Spt4
MAVITCRGCGAEADEKWESCPNCGGEPSTGEGSNAPKKAKACPVCGGRRWEVARDVARKGSKNVPEDDAEDASAGAYHMRCATCGYVAFEDLKPASRASRAGDAVEGVLACLPGCLVSVFLGTAVVLLALLRLRE